MQCLNISLARTMICYDPIVQKHRDRGYLQLFGMSADFWMNVQLGWDLYHVQEDEQADIDAIQPFMRAA